jgi:phospholipid-binding lipoprotein MlaA
MKMIHMIVVLSGLCLGTYRGICLAEPLALLSQVEASESFVQLDEEIYAALALKPLEPLKSEGPMDKKIENSEEAISPEPVESVESVGVLPDPLEPVNRVFFQVNDKFYFWILKPVASGYKAIVPQDLRVGVRNFFSNLTTPIRLVNCLLQVNF